MRTLLKCSDLGKIGERAKPLLVQLASYTYKKVITESLYKLKSVEEKFKKIIVVHDISIWR